MPETWNADCTLLTLAELQRLRVVIIDELIAREPEAGRCPHCGARHFEWPKKINPENGHIEEW